MRVVAVYPKEDTPAKYNYSVNYCLWDAMYKQMGNDFVKFPLEATRRQIDKVLVGADCLLLPMWRRIAKHGSTLRALTSKGIPTVMFDNDGCYQLPTSALYSYADFIFTRCSQRGNNTFSPTRGAWLPWSVDLDRFKPVFGGNDVILPGSATGRVHPVRRQILVDNIPGVKYKSTSGPEYVSFLQSALAGISTVGNYSKVARAKLLEMSACGCALITDRSEYLDRYFPEEWLYIFEDLEELPALVRRVRRHPKCVISRQKKLYEITKECHSADRQARLMIEALIYLSQRKQIPESLMHRIQYPLTSS